MGKVITEKVFFVTNALSGGGAERVMTVIANYLVEKGYEVGFLLLGEANNQYSLNEKIQIHVFQKKKKGDALGQIQFIRKHMVTHPQAVFVSFYTHQNMYTILASMGLRVRVIVSERNDPRESVHGKILHYAREKLYASPLCSHIVFQTKGARDYFPKKIQKKSSIIANPIVANLPEPFIGTRKKTVVSFGRLEAQKNYSMLINAFARFRELYPDYKLILYGKGSLEAELRNQSKELGISNSVEFAGFQKNIHDLILDAGMFVLPSDYEGLSNSMLEAMAIGLPVICTDCPPGGAREYISHGINGLLVPIKDVDKMYEALCQMASNTSVANSMGRCAAKVRYDLETNKICNRWEEVL